MESCFHTFRGGGRKERNKEKLKVQTKRNPILEWSSSELQSCKSVAQALKNKTHTKSFKQKCSSVVRK